MEKEDGIVKRILLMIGCMFGVLLMIAAGQRIASPLINAATSIVEKHWPTVINDAWITGAMYLLHIGIWIVLLLYLINNKKSHPILQVIGRKASGNTMKKFWLGILIGFLMNGICVLTAWLHHDITLTYLGFRPISFIIIFFCVLIQSSAEEVLMRGFLYQKAREYYKNPVIAILINSTLFAVLHLFNDGVTALSVLNIFLSGILFSFLVYYMDSLWCAFAVHTAWNFTQNILFGLPNSGMVVPYAVFQLDVQKSSNSFAYNVGFGIEGTIVADIVLLLACCIVFIWGRKHRIQACDVWNQEKAA